MQRHGLIVDIGGTNARFACVDPGGTIRDVWTCPVAEHGEFGSALATYIARGVTPGGAAIAAAGPVVDGRVQLTNAPWEIAVDDVSALLGGVPVHLVNDLEAVALALPRLSGAEVKRVVPTAAQAQAPRLAVNVGTGFGAALSVPARDGWVAVATEAGHVTLGPGPLAGDGATVEDVFSGPGLAALRASDVMSPTELRTVWSAGLGGVVRDLIQATGAWGGVYLCGGLMDAFDECVDVPAFSGALHAPGAMQARLVTVPVNRITVDKPAFIGLAGLLTG